ncbi:hypothetical protein [Nonomuraea recticatena]|uniref:hypothetical protein n=1 Tax=Nonomuraea recticatena TaxID=46178 RepID=UPI00361C51E6
MRQQVRIPLPDGGALAATVTLPEGTAPVAGWPGVVVVHEMDIGSEAVTSRANTKPSILGAPVWRRTCRGRMAVRISTEPLGAASL